MKSKSIFILKFAIENILIRGAIPHIRLFDAETHRIELPPGAEIIPFEPDPGNAGVEKIFMTTKTIFSAEKALAFGSFIAAMCAVAPRCEAKIAAVETDSTAATQPEVALPMVEITANRATSKTPIAFTNISKAELTRANDGRDMPYLLQLTPSMIATSDAGTGIGYTSMRVRGTDGSRINVTINGAPVNNPESHRVYWVDIPDIASSMADVQVQRGAGTSTNGAAAFGASINMLTDLPSDDSYAELAGAYGSYNSHRESLRVGSGLIRDHWSFDARVSHLGSDGYIERASANLWSYFGQAAYRSANTTVRLVAFGGKEVTYMAWNYATAEEIEKYGRRYNPCGLYIDDNGERAFYPEQKDRYAQHYFQLILNQRLSDCLRLNATLHYTKDFGYYTQLETSCGLVESGIKPFIGTDGQIVTSQDMIREKYLASRFGGAVFNLTYIHQRISAVAGGGINRFHGEHYGNVTWVRNYLGPINPDQPYYNFIGRKTDGNIFGRVNVDVSRTISVFADLQYRHIHYTIAGDADYWDYALNAPAPLDFSRDWNFFNPKAGLNFETGSHRAFASWSVAHKEPTSDNFVYALPHEYPRAERMFDYEAGYTFSHRLLTAGVNLYFMDYKNQLVLTGQLSDTGNPQTTNVPRSYRMGIELQGSLRPVGWFDWHVNLTLSRNRIRNFTEIIYDEQYANPIAIDRGDTPIAFSPDITFNNVFNFKIAGFDASLQSLYVGRQYLTNARSDEAMLHAYFISNLSAGYTFRHLLGIKSLRIGLNINNIFNEKYFSNGYAGAYYTESASGEKKIHHYAGYAAQAPTNVMATLNISF